MLSPFERLKEPRGNVDWWRPVVLIAAGATLGALAQGLGTGRRLAALRDWVDTLGIRGPVVFAVVYILAVVAAVPGSALTAATGALFGSGLGVAVASTAATIGASLSFLIARYFARDATARWLPGTNDSAAWTTWPLGTEPSPGCSHGHPRCYPSTCSTTVSAVSRFDSGPTLSGPGWACCPGLSSSWSHRTWWSKQSLGERSRGFCFVFRWQWLSLWRFYLCTCGSGCEKPEMRMVRRKWLWITDAHRCGPGVVRGGRGDRARDGRADGRSESPCRPPARSRLALGGRDRAGGATGLGGPERRKLWPGYHAVTPTRLRVPPHMIGSSRPQRALCGAVRIATAVGCGLPGLLRRVPT